MKMQIGKSGRAVAVAVAVAEKGFSHKLIKLAQKSVELSASADAKNAEFRR